MTGKKRTDPEKWDNTNFRLFPPSTKLLYFYLIDNCDWAGFLQLDKGAIAFKTRLKIKQIHDGLKLLSGELIVVEGWLLWKEFISLQDNDKNLNNLIEGKVDNVGTSIWNSFSKHGKHFSSNQEYRTFTEPWKELITSYSKGKGNSKGNSSSNN